MAVHNTLSDLGDYLFEELERLNDSSLSGDRLAEEAKRARAMSMTASGIVSAARTQVEALSVCANAGISVKQLPRMIAGGGGGDAAKPAER